MMTRHQLTEGLWTNPCERKPHRLHHQNESTTESDAPPDAFDGAGPSLDQAVEKPKA